VIFQSGMSEDGRNLAARVAEGLFSHAESFEAAQAYYADIRERVSAAGRNPDHVISIPNASPVVAPTDAEAQARAREIYEEDNDFDRKIAFIGRTFGAYDFTQHDLDEPFPDLTDRIERGGRRGLEIIQRAQSNGWSIRQTVEAVSAYRPQPFVGAPETVADEIQRWFEGRASDGFNLAFRLPEDLTRFVDAVVPILQERGIYRTEYEATTLRGNLGLPIPESRHTPAREARELSTPALARA
jgi:alkanesulfonate monooxygenase SsuD/methylene tetrahydromethanopterin reductase-like flavin-dependent oxidoreductase (luciferase family)